MNPIDGVSVGDCERPAPGGPGIEPHWTRSVKDAMGTAYSSSSRLWYAMARGVLSEVYYPTIDKPQVRDLQHMVTDGETFFHDERHDMESHVEVLSEPGLGVRITSRYPKGRYRIHKEVIADPHLPVVLLETREGWLYLATVLAVCSRKVIGWAMDRQMGEGLVERALQMAAAHRRPPEGVLHHSDRGSQYAAHNYQGLLNAHQMVCSMSRKGDGYDNAMMESLFSTLKSECANGVFDSRAEARLSIFEYIEVWYNRERRPSSLGYQSPEAFEQAHARLFCDSTKSA